MCAKLCDMGKYIATKLNKDGKLFYVKNKINKATYVDVLFDSGARCDTIPGLAHFCEHMFFSGTKTMTKDEVWKKYWSFIATNAQTSLRDIVFTANIFTNELGDYLSTIATLITESTVTNEAINKERKVINQEIAGYSDKHSTISYTFNRYNLFNLPAYKEITFCGSTKTIAQITRKDIVGFIKKYFVANNLQIYICSPLSLNKVKRIANKNLADKLPINDKLEKLDVEFYDVVNNNFVKTKQVDIQKTYINLNIVFPHDYYDFEFYKKLELALDIINDSSIGLLKQLRLKKDLVYGGYVTYLKMKQNCVLIFSCNCEPNNVNEVIKTTAEYFKSIFNDGFTEENLKRVKRYAKHGDATKLPSFSLLFNRLSDYRWYGKVLDHKKLKKIKAKATVEDCNNAIKEALTNGKVSLSLYGQIDKENAINKKQLNEMFKFN